MTIPVKGGRPPARTKIKVAIGRLTATRKWGNDGKLQSENWENKEKRTNTHNTFREIYGAV